MVSTTREEAKSSSGQPESETSPNAPAIASPVTRDEPGANRSEAADDLEAVCEISNTDDTCY